MVSGGFIRDMRGGYGVAQEHRLSVAATAKELDKAFASATKALSVMGVKMALKKPDAAKLQPIFEQSKKKAEFKLVVNKSVLTVVVDLGGNVTQLGELDLERESDREKKKLITQELVESGCLPRSALDEFEEGMDPKVLANTLSKLSKDIASVSKDVAADQDTLKKLQIVHSYWVGMTCKKLKTHPDQWAEFEAYARKKDCTESMLYLRAVNAGMANQKLIDTFIKENSPYMINLPAKLSSAIQAGTVSAASGAVEIEGMLDSDILVRFSALKNQPVVDRIDTVRAHLAGLQAQLKTLQDQRDDLKSR